MIAFCYSLSRCEWALPKTILFSEYSVDMLTIFLYCEQENSHGNSLLFYIVVSLHSYIFIWVVLDPTEG